MLEQDKILILNLLEELPVEIEAALGIDSIEIVSTVDALEGREPFYILINESSKIPESELIKNSRSLCFDNVENVKEFLRNKGDVIFNPDFAKSDVGLVLIERFFSRSTVVQLESAYGDILEKSFSTKFSSPLTIGYYSDIIAKFAHAEKSDIAGLRTFLSSVSSFFTYLTKDKVSWFPLDVDYGMTDDAMIVQVIAPVTKVYKDYVIQSLTDDNPANPFVGLMDICINQTHAMDMYYLEKANKLVITGVWLKDESAYKKGYYSSLLINNLYTFDELKDLRKNTLTSKVKMIQSDIELNYDAIPGAGVDNFEEESFEENKNLLSIKKLIEFIKDYREKEIDPKNPEDLALRDVAIYLRKYPEQQEIKVLEQEDREVILKCLKKETTFEELEETVTVVKSSIDKNDFLQSVLDNLTEMDEDDAVKIMSSSSEEVIRVVKSSNQKETVQTISGGEEEDPGNYVVKSLSSEIKDENMELKTLDSIERETKNKKEDSEFSYDKEIMEKKVSEPDIELGNIREEMRKKNSRGNQEDVLGDWEIRKKKISEKVTHRIEALQNTTEEVDIQSLERDILTVFREELGEDNVDEAAVKSMTGGVADQLTNEKLLAVYDAKKKIEKEKSNQIIALRDEQLLRMKKVLDIIKTENSNLKIKLSENISSTAKDFVNSSNDTEVINELKIVQHDLQEAQKASGIKDTAIDKLKDSQKTAIENKNKQIAQVEQRLSDFLDSQNKEGSVDIATEMKKVSNENRLLQSQIDLKDKTIETMSKKIDSNLKHAENKANSELEKLREQNIVVLEAMRVLKAEKSQLESKVRLAQRDVRQKETELNIEKAKQSNSTGDSSESRTKDKEIQAQKIEHNKVLDTNKALGIRIKQLEQKMKFLNAQVETANKNKGGGRSAKGGGAAAGNEAKLALKLKQTEFVKEKMVVEAKKLNSQLDSRKKESIAMSKENNILKNKINELESKLNRFEKKAS